MGLLLLGRRIGTDIRTLRLEPKLCTLCEFSFESIEEDVSIPGDSNKVSLPRF